MAENKKKQVKEDLPKPESMKKANKKISFITYGIIILFMVVILTSNLEGDIGEGIFLIAALVAIVSAIVMGVKRFKHRAR